MDDETADLITKNIIADLKDRRDLGDIWDSLDEETQREIAETWTKIIKGAD